MDAVDTRAVIRNILNRVSERVLQATTAVVNRHPRVRQLQQEIAARDEALKWHRLPAFMHNCHGAAGAPGCVAAFDQPTPQTREAARRVIDAFHRSKADDHEAAPSLWGIARGIFYQEFIGAIEARNVEQVESILARTFQTSIIWGTCHGSPQCATELARGPRDHYLCLRATDVLCSLAEAVGVRPPPSIEQLHSYGGYMQQMHINLEELVARVESATGLDLSFPRVAGAMGVEIGGRFFTIGSIHHSYSVYRLRELGAQPEDSIVEIGGGYGCLANLFARAGYNNYEIIDLPWINAVQGYFLLRSLPPESVCLYGEDHGGGIRVSPCWAFHQHAERSIDYVMNINSLPEIGLADAREYLASIARVTRKMFYSINQETQAAVPGVGQQGCVPALAAETRRLQRVSRFLNWMEQGYVEEHYVPLRENAALRAA